MNEDESVFQSGPTKECNRDNTTECKTKGAVGKPFRCEFCGKTFAHGCTLGFHERIHIGKKPYECQYCDKAFSHTLSLENHRRTYSQEERHKNRIEYVRDRSGEICKDEKPFKCEVCGGKFAKAARLRRHTRRIHTGEKSHMCELCG